MLKPLLAAAALLPMLIVPTLAAEQWIAPKANGQILFNTPSENIGCTYTPDGGTDNYEPMDPGPELICDRIEPSYYRIILSYAGVSEYEDPDDPSCCSVEKKLRYGNTLTLEGFVCYSEKTGLTCETDDGEHGFVLSRKTVETW